MRYVDRPTVECDVFIEADLTRVWELVSDIELSAQFSPELRRVRWLDNASPPVLGARFEATTRTPCSASGEPSRT